MERERVLSDIFDYQKDLLLEFGDYEQLEYKAITQASINSISLNDVFYTIDGKEITCIIENNVAYYLIGGEVQESEDQPGYFEESYYYFVQPHLCVERFGGEYE